MESLDSLKILPSGVVNYLQKIVTRYPVTHMWYKLTAERKFVILAAEIIFKEMFLKKMSWISSYKTIKKWLTSMSYPRAQ